MQTIVYQCDTAMPAQKLPNCCNDNNMKNRAFTYKFCAMQHLLHLMHDF